MLPAITIAEQSDPKAPYILQGRPLVQSLQKAGEYGFQGVELQLRSPEDLNQTEFFSTCEQFGIRLISIATGPSCREGLSLSSRNKTIREKAVARIFQHIDFAARCGHAPDIMIGLLAGRREPKAAAGIFEQNLGDSLHRISEYAARQGIAVNLEPVNHLDNDGLHTWEETVSLLDTYDCPNVRLGLDLFHLRLEERDIFQTIHRFAHRIGCVQMMDENRKVPGLGCFCFDSIVPLVREIGYDGPITMECLPEPDPETALRMAQDFYIRYFA